MLSTEQPLSEVLPQLLDGMDIVVAEVSDATYANRFPGMTDYSDIIFSNLCPHKKIMGSDIESTYIFLFLSTHPSMVSCLSRLHIRSPIQQLRQ